MRAAMSRPMRLVPLALGLLTACGQWEDRSRALEVAREALGCFDVALEQAAAIALGALALTLVVGLVLVYFWIRAMMRLAWLAFAGTCLAVAAGAVVLAGEGIVPVPPWLAETSVLAALAGGLLLLLGVVRMLRAPAAR